MWKRSSFVQNIFVTSIQLASVLEIGDSKNLLAKSNVFAAQREKELFFSTEGNLNDYPIFSEPIPIPPFPFPVPVINRLNEVSKIRVKTIAIKGLSASAIVQIGNTEKVDLESRVFHVRHLTEHNDRSH